ncbi:hypothetical protein BGX28_001745 [Mortierella sp. GBA30]|nr:hypothetical protein BGX28_001745 [Mortierella sp. GBA30]
MQTYSRHLPSTNWSLRRTLALGVVLTLLSSTLAAPLPHAIFPNQHSEQEQQQPISIGAAPATILDILGARPEFSKLLELPTLFAPTNEAFDSISDIDYPTRDVLMYHISDQAYISSRLRYEHVIKSFYESPGLDYAAQLLRISLEQPSIPSSSYRNSLWKVEPGRYLVDLKEAENDDDSSEAKGEESGLYINRAKVTIPDLIAQSGAVVHGVNRIIRPPGETVLDEITRRGVEFSCLVKAWTESGVDLHVRDGKGLTLFAAADKAWKALPKKLRKWLFSNQGREHLKIFTMYQIANKAVYTPEIFNKTLEDGTPGTEYRRLSLQTLLHSPKYHLEVQGQERKRNPVQDERITIAYKPNAVADLIEAFKARFQIQDLFLWDEPTASMPPSKPEPGHHYPRHDHLHHHGHRGVKHHVDSPHHGDDSHDGGNELIHPIPPKPRRDEIIVNKKAYVLHGYENWIAGNGVIHVVDKVLMPPRSKGCESMSATECAAWETIWDLANVDFESLADEAKVWWDDLTLFDGSDGESAENDEAEQEFHTWGAEGDLEEDDVESPFYLTL